MEIAPLLERVPDHRELLGLEALGARMHALVRDFPGLARIETVGRSREGRPIDLVIAGHGGRAVLLVGAPHPNEPIGTLTIEFLLRLVCEDEALRRDLDVTVYAIPVADPDGLVLNEGWLGGGFSPVRYALEFYRPPHHEQVEWSFPVSYESLVFTTPTPETQAVMRVMERVRPRVFYALHNAGFCGVYFYVTGLRTGLVEALHGLVAAQGLVLHRGEPEVPYLRTLAPAVYELFGVSATYDHLRRTLGEDPAPLIASGTCSDDWLAGIEPGAFSIVAEVPYYTASALEDVSSTATTRRDAVRAGADRAAAIHGECEAAFRAVADRAPDHRLTRSVVDYLRKTPKRLAALRATAEGADHARPATVAELTDATVCTPFYHALYLGEAHRVAALAGDSATADRLAVRVEALVTRLAGEAGLTVLPLRPLVAVQAGAGLAAIASVVDAG